MKKIIFLICSILILLYSFGCSENNNTEKTTENITTIENKESTNNTKKAESESIDKNVKTISYFENSKSAEISFEVLKEAYKRIGITLKHEIYPSKRGLEKSNAGEIAGETMRIKGIEKNYPNLIMIDEPVYELDFVAVVKNKKFDVNGPESLKPYKLGHVRGILFIENMTKGMNVEAVDDVNSLVQKINLGRTDVGIISRQDAIKEITTTGLDLTILEPAIQKLYLYHYLHKDNSYLIEKITTSLQEMKNDGTWEKIIKR